MKATSTAGFRHLAGRGSGALLVALAAVLSIAALSLASVSHPKAGGYTGATSQGKQVTFKVVGEKVKNPKFTVTLGGCSSTVTIFGSDRISDSGRFAIDGSGATALRGKFVSGTKAKGTATLEFPAIYPTPSCGTKTVSFTAKHR